MRGVALPPIGMQRDRHFSHLRTEQTRLDDHFGSELHPCAALIETVVGFTGESAHATIHVVNFLRLEPPAHYPGKERVTEPPMQERHGPRHHAAAARGKPASLYQIESLPELCHELGGLEKVVTVIRVAHDDVLAARGCDASH